jgi:glucuronokinase
MQTIETHAYARAALAGNPSDGYFGKTLSLCLSDFSARVVLTASETLEIVPSCEDLAQFASIREMADDVRRNGYYGGLRLVKAALKKFVDYCDAHQIELPADHNFSLRYETDIPRQVGLAGSSAIITATWRALMQHYRVLVPREVLPAWVRAVEQEELGITGGLQDRVAQSYGGLVFMDFERTKLERDGFGTYELLDIALLSPLYLAYATRFAEESGVVHNDLRALGKGRRSCPRDNARTGRPRASRARLPGQQARARIGRIDESQFRVAPPHCADKPIASSNGRSGAKLRRQRSFRGQRRRDRRHLRR